MESQPQNPEFRNDPETFTHVLHTSITCTQYRYDLYRF